MKTLLLLISLLLSGMTILAQENTNTIVLPPASMLEDEHPVYETVFKSELVIKEVDSILLMDRQIPLFTITKLGYPTSYLFGTVHLVPFEYAITVDSFAWIFSDINQVYLEIANIDQLDKIDLKRDPKKDRDFLSYFTPEQQDSIFAFAKEHCDLTKGMIKMSNQHFKPFLIEQMLSIKSSQNKTADYSYDIDIASYARTFGHAIKGLETVKDQMFFFSGQDSLNTNQNIMNLVRNPLSNKNISSPLYKAYFSGDVDKIYQYIAGEFTDQAYREKLLDKRNLNWMKKIPKILKKNPTLIAVGAGHLAGELGLIHLLQKQGFKITPVKP